MIGIVRPPSRGTLAAAVAGAVALLLMLVLWHGRETAYNNYIYLADAWRHGRLWVTFPGERIDAMPFHGRAYVIEAPVPAILAYPFVLLFGMAAQQTLLSELVGAIAVFAAWRLCQRIGLDRRESLAATAFLFFGTSLFVCSTVGAVWFLAHVTAVAASLLALAEYFGKRRAWLVAVWALVAGFSRYPLLVVVPCYLVLLMAAPRPKLRATLKAFALPIVPVLVAWAVYNYSRWKTLTDPGYALWYRVMQRRSAVDPQAFSLEHIPHQLLTMLLQTPHLSALPPWIAASTIGLGLIYTSLPFLYAAFAGATLETFVLWTASGVLALCNLAYFDPGGEQFGQRHALDFEPFLFALLLLAMKRRPSRDFTSVLAIFAVFGFYEAIVWLFFRGSA